MTDQPTAPSVEPTASSVEPVETTRPALRVVKGDPTAEELAALVAVVASLGGGAEAPATRRTPVWNAPSRIQRGALRPGSGAWRQSGLPQ